MEILNWTKLPPHPTDTYVHWSDKNPVETMEKLRKAYDSLVGVDKKALELLLDTAYEAGRSDEHDFNDPDL